MIIAKQSARNQLWINGLIGVAIGSAALLFIPGAGAAPWLWAAAMSVIAAGLAHVTLAQHSWLTQDDNGKLTLCIRDNNSRATTYIEQSHITRIELCDYRLLAGTQTPDWIEATHHRKLTKPGYTGPGLIVQYRIPPGISGDEIARSYQFPAPDAGQFQTALGNHSILDT